MGTRLNFASLSFRSGATGNAFAELGLSMLEPFWLKLARGRIAQTSVKTAAADMSGHLGSMAGASYQSFAFGTAQDLYGGTAKRKDTRTSSAKEGSTEKMQESAVGHEAHLIQRRNPCATPS
jgi:hypothetical protein